MIEVEQRKNMKALNVEMDTGSLCMKNVLFMYNEFFKSMDYDWWYKVQPGDVCVDVGACVGMFTAHALDLGASKVYMIEPNKDLMQTALKNCYDYIVDQTEQRIVPIGQAIGSDSSHTERVFYTDDFKTTSFKDFLARYNIEHIDYLKLDCEGGEYDVLSEENFDFIRKNVKHISLEVHLRATDDGIDKFINFRNKFLVPYINENRVRFQDTSISTLVLNDSELRNPNRPREFMMYLING